MPGLLDAVIPPPANEEVFENMILGIYARLWNDSELNGRRGQEQNGVDVYGYPADLNGKPAGIQCKKYCNTKLTEARLKTEVKKAETFEPELGRYIIATTTSRDAKLQRVVRLINAGHRNAGKFTVQILFWENVCREAQEHYPGGIARVFAHFYPTSYQLVTQDIRDQLASGVSSLPAASEWEQETRAELEGARKDLNAGYIDAAQARIVKLLARTDVEAEPQGKAQRETIGRIYRLAAFAFLPGNVSGDTKTARAYLNKARHYLSSEEGITSCQVVEALLVYRSHSKASKDAALALLDGVDHPDAERIRFVIHYEANELDICASMLVAHREDGVLQTNEWLRPLALYYGEVGDMAALDGIIAQLTVPGTDASDYSTAAYALTRAAYVKYRNFCESHHICPDANLGKELGLGELIDSDAEERSAFLYEQAFELYNTNHAEAEAEQCLESAIRLRMGTMDAATPDTLLIRLTELNPTNQFALRVSSQLAPVEVSYPGGKTPLEDLDDMLIDQGADPTQILNLAAALMSSPQLHEDTLKRLLAHEARFSGSPQLHANYLFLTFDLLTRSGSDIRTSKWLKKLKAPEGYKHLKVLLNLMYFMNRDLTKMGQWVRHARKNYPHHPEILLLMVHYYHLQHEHDEAIKHARHLFGILRTAGTAQLLLTEYSVAQRHSDYLELEAATRDLPRDEVQVRRGSAYAHLGLRQLLQSRQQFQWLNDKKQARAQDILNLANIHEKLGQFAASIAVLKEGQESYPDEIGNYIGLSRVYLKAGDIAESYKWASDAYDHFPAQPEVVRNLISISLPTGYDDDTTVRGAFKEALAGGTHEQSGIFTQVAMNDFRRMVEERHLSMRDVHEFYEHGRLPLMMLQHSRRNTLFEAHAYGIEYGKTRYFAPGNQGNLAERFPEPPAEVVLDYSALLTVWSLYGNRWLAMLRSVFEKVWVSATLVDILDWEHSQLALRGNLSEYRARVAVRDAVLRQPTKFKFEPAVDSAGGSDVLGFKTESTISEQLGLPHLDEWAEQHEVMTEHAFGLQTLADVLAKAGAIDPHLKQTLCEYRHQPSPEEEMVAGLLSQGTSVVASMNTLVQLARDGGIDAFCLYFGEVHIALPAWQRLASEIEASEKAQKWAQEIQRLHAQFGSALEDKSGFLEFASAPTHLRWINKDGESEPGPTEVGDLIYDYLNDMLALSRMHTAPIWSDDRWFSGLQALDREDLVPLFVMGSDLFLLWRRVETGDEALYFHEYGQLIAWKYLGLATNPEYVMWLVSQGYLPHQGVLADALGLYRQNMLSYSLTTVAGRQAPRAFRGELIEQYISGLSEILYRCFEGKTLLERCAEVFRELDLSKYDPAWEGQEPRFYSQVLHKAITGWIFDRDHLAAGREAAEDHEELKAFAAWLHEMLAAAGIDTEELEEAWYVLLEGILEIEKGLEAENATAFMRLLCMRLFQAMPDHVVSYLVSSPLQSRIEAFMGDLFKIGDYMMVTLDTADGSRRVSIKRQVWDRDLTEATLQAMDLDAERSGVITEGSVSIRTRWFAPGSVFLVRQETPTELFQADATSWLEPGVLCILWSGYSRRREEREAFWRRGRQKLESLGFATDEWDAWAEQAEPLAGREQVPLSRDPAQYLLSILPIARYYLGEASSLSAGSALIVLDNVEPSTVRAWIGLPEINWDSEEALVKWAEDTASTTVSRLITQATGASPETGAALGLTRSIASGEIPAFGNSVFADARVWHRTVCDVLAGESANDVAAATADLLDFGERVASAVIKANIVVTLLLLDKRLDGQLLNGSILTAEQRQRLELLLLRVVSLSDMSRKHEDPFALLEAYIADYFYARWRGRLESSPVSSRELAYLAEVGAALVVGSLVDAGSATTEVVDELLGQLNARTHQEWLRSAVGSEAPPGLFKPRWGTQVSYALSYLLQQADAQELDLDQLITDKSRLSLATAGLLHRFVQACIGYVDEERDWLDSGLTADVALKVAELLSPAMLFDPDSLSEKEKWYLALSADGQAGQTLIMNRLDNLVTADDDEAIGTINTSFRAAPHWRMGALEIVQQLLEPGRIECIQRSPRLYRQLVVELMFLSLTASDLPQPLGDQINEIVYGVPLAAPNAAELLAVQADILSQLASYERHEPAVNRWITSLGTNSGVPTSLARVAIRPFIRAMDGYTDEIRNSLNKAFSALAEFRGYRTLWEIARIQRDCMQVEGA